jgi:hypothetical protein
MARQYRPMLPLWFVQEKLRLTDKYPSGLEWAETTARHVEGQMAGYLEQKKRYYVVSLCGEKYHAHRIVYYLRTGTDPGNADVLRPDGTPRDALPKELVLEQRKTPKPPTRRNRRKSEWY